MSLDVGSIVSGKVAKITNFGAFIKLSSGNTGLCHISEISNGFVKEVADVLQLDQEVTVKVLSVKDDGKVSLSIKQAQPQESGSTGDKPQPSGGVKKRDFSKKREFSRPPREVDFFKDNKPKEESFEDMLSGYMKNSTDKLKKMKKQRSRKGNGYNR